MPEKGQSRCMGLKTGLASISSVGCIRPGPGASPVACKSA